MKNRFLNEKENYKTEDIKTFPQVYLKKDNTKDSLLLGGFSDFNNLINTFHKKYDQKDLINFQKQSIREEKLIFSW